MGHRGLWAFLGLPRGVPLLGELGNSSRKGRAGSEARGGWLVRLLVGLSVGWLVSRSDVGQLVSLSVGWLVGWLGG